MLRDLDALMALPPTPYDPCEKVSTRATSISMVRYRGNDYSVPVAYAHGYRPERSVQTGIGALEVRRPKSLPRTRCGVRDRAEDVPAERNIRFSSGILTRWARRSKSLDALLPVLYLRGISTGDLQEALSALLGTDAPTPSSLPAQAPSSKSSHG